MRRIRGRLEGYWGGVREICKHLGLDIDIDLGIDLDLDYDYDINNVNKHIH